MGAGHGHGAGASLGPVPRHLKVLIGLLVGPLVLATVVGLALLWPDGDLALTTPGAEVQRGTAEVQLRRAVPPRRRGLPAGRRRAAQRSRRAR